jgi:hypothetical protein
MGHPQSQSYTTDLLESSLPPSPPLESFPTYVEFHGILDPNVYEQTQAQHYFSLILACGLQTLGDQSNA